MTARIGIFGGSFDPVHCGHLRIAQGVALQLSLDLMHFVPCGQHAFKKIPGASAAQRLAMLELAVAELRSNQVSQWQVNPLETERQGVSYTVDTCRWFRDSYGPQAILCLLLGTDAMNSFHRWQNWREVTQLVNVVLVDRAEPDSGQLGVSEEADSDSDCEKEAYQLLSPNAEVERWLADAVPSISAAAGQVTRIKLTPQPFSSTQIRSLLSAPCDGQQPVLESALPAVVREYIVEHHLYQQPATDTI